MEDMKPRVYWFGRTRWWVVRHFMPWRRLPVHYGPPPAEGDDE